MSGDFGTSSGAENHLIKIIFVGNSGVGKTCLMSRLFSDKFNHNTPATIGCDTRFKRLKFDNKNIGLTLWDTAGQERFQAVTSTYYRGAQGVVYVYDVTCRESLLDVQRKWMREFRTYGTFPGAVQMLVANKVDLVDHRVVTAEEGSDFAKAHGLLYRETSARTDQGVYDALIWGLICAIVDTPELLRSNHSSAGGVVTLAAADDEYEDVQQRQRRRSTCCR